MAEFFVSLGIVTVFVVCVSELNWFDICIGCIQFLTVPSSTGIFISDTGPQPGLLPNHKQSILLFLERVYGIASQDMLFDLLEQSFLPDLRAATMMDSVRIY